MEHYALITGTTSDLGLAYAKRFAGKGYNLIVTGRRKEVVEKRAQETRSEYTCKVIVILVDLASEGGVRKLLASLEGREVYVLMNSAGLGFRTSFSDTDIDGLKCLIYLQTAAVAEMTHHVLEGIKERNKGIIISISSDGAFVVVSGNVTYAASERSIATLTEGLHVKPTGTEIRVQVVCPGFTDTDFHENNGMRMDRTRRGMFEFRQLEDVVDKAMREFEKGKVIYMPDKTGKLTKAMVEYTSKRIYYRFANDFVNENTRKN